ncbi:sugar transferase [Microvirga pudoricolor]|uniref:sugar transferase n=1 Tax=Microvirga pudoricolor TaxID=2778729 RepID=UPI00194E0D16|nr:sugar transferase [Microvirga pudoricolor]MBM6593008.1 sugar transferase [Microvirga pudoricolor]
MMDVSSAACPDYVPAGEPALAAEESSSLSRYGYTRAAFNEIERFTGQASNSTALLEAVTEAHSREAAIQFDSVLIGPPLNEVPDITGFMRAAFFIIATGGYVICHLESADQRSSRLFGSNPTGSERLLWILDYLLHRVIPRLGLTRAFYRFLWPNHRVLSRAEALGRVVHAGYALKATFESAGQFFIIAQRETATFIERPAPSKGVLFKMNRVGQFGRVICVYKLRTMHPYSEYLQEYMHRNHGLDVGGKFKHDFRIISPGRFMRKYWLDEIPMLLNLLKGDIKLVGVRPLSMQYFSLYPQEARTLRMNYKPGLIPPYYADLPKDFEAIVESELRYLKSYNQAPYLTDAKYLCQIAYNILWKRAYSK